jgi:hypothetical protein
MALEKVHSTKACTSTFSIAKLKCIDNIIKVMRKDIIKGVESYKLLN